MSDLEHMFITLWRIIGGPALEAEYRFHPQRRFRFDFAYPAAMVAIELEGGQYTGGRHTRPMGYAADCEKYNLAAAMGWRVFRFTRSMLEENPADHLMQVKEVIYETA